MPQPSFVSPVDSQYDTFGTLFVQRADGSFQTYKNEDFAEQQDMKLTRWYPAWIGHDSAELKGK